MLKTAVVVDGLQGSRDAWEALSTSVSNLEDEVSDGEGGSCVSAARCSLMRFSHEHQYTSSIQEAWVPPFNIIDGSATNQMYNKNVQNYMLLTYGHGYRPSINYAKHLSHQ